MMQKITSVFMQLCVKWNLLKNDVKAGFPWRVGKALKNPIEKNLTVSHQNPVPPRSFEPHPLLCCKVSASTLGDTASKAAHLVGLKQGVSSFTRLGTHRCSGHRGTSYMENQMMKNLYMTSTFLAAPQGKEPFHLVLHWIFWNLLTYFYVSPWVWDILITKTNNSIKAT